MPPPHERPDDCCEQSGVQADADGGAADPLQRERQACTERGRERRDEEVVDAVRQRAAAGRRIERVPVVPRVRDEPRERSDHGSADHEPRGSEQLSPSPDEPGDCGESNDEHLRRRPPAEPEREAEQQQVAACRPLVEAKREQHDGQTEHERHAVEAVCPRRLPDDVRGPDPERRPAPSRAYGSPTVLTPIRHVSRAPTANRASGTDAESLDARSGQREHPCCQERFLAAPITLTPVERTELAVQDVARHRSGHRFVRIEDAALQADDPDPEDDSCSREADDHRSDPDSAHAGSYDPDGVHTAVGAER